MPLRLDQAAINAIDKELDGEEKSLENDLKKVVFENELIRIRARLMVLRDKRTALARIVTRNMVELDSVERKVFVSAHFENGDLPVWLKAVFAHMNESRALGKFKAVYGKPNAGENFLDVILQKMVSCHIFLSVVTKPVSMVPRLPADGSTQNNLWPIDPYLVEELGAAFTLPVPVIIAVEEGMDIPKEAVGLMMGNQAQRCPFRKDRPEDFAQYLAPALDGAPANQKLQNEKVFKALGRLFN